MITTWGEQLNPANPLPEYPRPQMRRELWLNLNGPWQYAITKDGAAPDKMDGEIIVPFSPECELSTVGRCLRPEETLWYTRPLDLPEAFSDGRVLLHFGAVDQMATVYLNGQELGSHTGGYTAFSFDLTPYLKPHNVLTVKVRDVTDASYHSRGKQKTKRGGIWYTPQSGIWQTVWCEWVPQSYIASLMITPLFDESAVEITAKTDDPLSRADCVVRVGDVVAYGTANLPVRMSMKGFLPWSPESPYLYDMEVRVGEDTVKSYFAMRKFSAERDDKGVPRLFLNGEPYFHNGLLDQGYWPDGLYTAPSDEAMVHDILTMKAMGFNTLRKHIKIEPLRWYYHCDRLGMLVWQDMPNGGGAYKAPVVTFPVMLGNHITDGQKNYRRFGRESAAGRAQFYAELNEMISQLYNCPCIAMWVPFNEGWGQFDAAAVREAILALDNTRTVDHASGWHDQAVGELQSLHVYFKPFRFKADSLGRVVALSEFGGYNRRVEGHCLSKKDFGYKRFKTDEALLQAFVALYQNEIAPAKAQGLAAAIYTQVSDVEDELNGLMTYDRAVIKLPVEAVRQMMDSIISPF